MQKFAKNQQQGNSRHFYIIGWLQNPAVVLHCLCINRKESQMEHDVIQLANQIIYKEPKRRPEADWVQQIVDRFAKAEGVSGRTETDQLIYKKMYGKAAKKTDTVKIRYWRTGHHLPSSREEAIRFSKVLQMSQSETIYFLQSYMEKSDLVFDILSNFEESSDYIYKQRRLLMETMISEYIAKIPISRIVQIGIPYEKLAIYTRHLYCLDALSATSIASSDCQKAIAKDHMSSGNYESEFLRICKLSGEFPRRTMLRHIFLLSIPYLNRRLLDERLNALGYLPLTEGHTNQHSALIDDLIIGFLDLYETFCSGKDPLTCRHWMFEQLSKLDQYLSDIGKDEYRFLNFRILSTMADYR